MEVPKDGDLSLFENDLNKNLFAEIVDVSEIKNKEGEIVMKGRKWKVTLKDVTNPEGNVLASSKEFLWWISSMKKLGGAWGDSDNWKGKRISFTLIENDGYVNERGVFPA